MTKTVTTLKMSQVDQAISNILGKEDYEGLKNIFMQPRPQLLNTAIIVAFSKKLDNQDTDRLREAYNLVAKHGHFPKEMWDVED